MTESTVSAFPISAGAEAASRGAERPKWIDDSARLKAIFDATPALVFLVDPDSRFIFLNRAGQAALGLGEQQVIGRPVSDLFPRNTALRMMEQQRRLLSSTAALEEELALTVAGAERTFLLRKLTLTNGSGAPAAICGLYVDISEQKRSESRLRLLSEIASALVLRGDDAAGFMAEMCRKLAAELGGDLYFHYQPSSDRRLHLTSHGGIDAGAAGRLEWLDYGSAVCGTVASTQRAWVIADVRASDDPRLELVRELGVRGYACFPLLCNGTLFGTLSLGRRGGGAFAEQDIALMQTVADLAAVALDRSARARELLEIDRHRKEFLAVLAHELRGPLAPIAYAVALLREGAHDARIVETARGMIERQAGNLSGLVDELLDDARVSQGKIALDAQAVAVERVVQDAIELCRPLLNARGHALTASLPAHPVLVNGDPRRLTQVTANLLANSAKYTPPGGRIEVEVVADPAIVAMHIRDNGIGIARDALPRVFNLFEQAHASRTAQEGGLGIGLALVKALVELHGGSIEAYSAGVGKGSEFTVRLPRLTGVEGKN